MNAKTAKQFRRMAKELAASIGVTEQVLYDDKKAPIQLFEKNKDGVLAPYMGTSIVSRRMNQACIRKIYKNLKKDYKNS